MNKYQFAGTVREEYLVLGVRSPNNEYKSTCFVYKGYHVALAGVGSCKYLAGVINCHH